ncbi:unnamed protein product [Blepharisma stoltei]|uniref:ABC transporter domain-containing protein n=1 Tax=Blepharisma stoltei TaxID=1481888 RepID=A0AAU9IML5_9CILI|nr:unnamed protein product [Blepharisma stoltei]
MFDNQISPKESEESRSEHYSSDIHTNGKDENIHLQADGQLHRHVQLSWEDVNYYASVDGKRMHILKGVSGHANPGEFLAIMGASGSGKTSLLNILANRARSGNKAEMTGTIFANGKDAKEFNISKYAAYVTQDDVLLPVLTPRDCLMFYAKLRCPGTDKERHAKVEEILNDLNIARIAENLIGNAMIKGISGGEKKRVCIGIELMSDPCIIMLDEPTSGLDSYNAGVVVDLLLKQAAKGRTIISTIHQPSSNVFKKFDKLFLLAEGNVVYHGPCDKSRKYFAELGYKCPKQVNPADYYMRMLHITNRHEITEEEQGKLDC